MKLQYMFLDFALDLWPLSHFELGLFASRIGRLEMRRAALGFSNVRSKLATMGSFQHSKRSESKRCTVEVR